MSGTWIPSVRNHFVPRWHFCGHRQNPWRAAHCQTQVRSPWPWTLTEPLHDLALGSLFKFYLISCHSLPASPTLLFSPNPKDPVRASWGLYSPGNLCWILNTLLITLPSSHFFALKFCLCLLLFLSYSFLKGKSVLYLFIMSPRNSHSAWHIENLQSICTKLILPVAIGKAKIICWKVHRGWRWVLPSSDFQCPDRKVMYPLSLSSSTWEDGTLILYLEILLFCKQLSLYPSWVLRCGLKKIERDRLTREKIPI